jgi:ribonuclease D
MWSSDWDAAQLSNEQIQYAALDAWVVLQILDILENKPTVGQPLKSAAPVGQHVSIRNPGLSSLSHSSHLQFHTTNVYIKGMQE